MLIESKVYPAVALTMTEAGANAAADALQIALDSVQADIEKMVESDDRQEAIETRTEARAHLHELWATFNEPRQKRHSGRLHWSAPLAAIALKGK